VIDPDLIAAASWTAEPAAWRRTDDGLEVTAVRGSDAWRHTSYGFVHDDAHGLLAPFGARDALEVSFHLDYGDQFDQAGLLLRASPETWVKAGVEVSDGIPQVGAVVTHGRSDWSVAPVPGWSGREVTVRASRDGDAVTVRARVDDEPWGLVRVAPVDPGTQLRAGPYCCAPTRAGLVVRFTSWRRTDPDPALH
jgi:regulation of enolase protein 1 (concanavalin A-like superfamily)